MGIGRHFLLGFMDNGAYGKKKVLSDLISPFLLLYYSTVYFLIFNTTAIKIIMHLVVCLIFLVPCVVPAITLRAYSFLCIYLYAALFALQKSILFTAKELDYLVYFLGINTLQ